MPDIPDEHDEIEMIMPSGRRVIIVTSNDTPPPDESRRSYPCGNPLLEMGRRRRGFWRGLLGGLRR